MVYVKQESELGFWTPNIGEVLEGEVTEITTGMYGKQLLIKTLENNTMKTPSHKVLQAKLNKVVVGDKVRIVYVKDDLPTLKGNNPTKIYDVFVDKIVEELVK